MGRVQISAGYEGLVRDLGLHDPALAAGFSRGDVVKSTGSSRVLRFRAPREEDALYYLKIYRYPRLRPKVKYALRSCRARAEFDSLEWLQRAGLPGVVPVAWGSVRRCRLIQSCFLLTKGIEDAEDLEQHLPRFFEQPRTPEWHARKRKGLLDLAQVVARMHAAGFFDGDLFFRNILTTERHADGEETPLWFLDHPKGRVIPERKGRGRRDAAAIDLASLDLEAPLFFSRTERLRFFLAHQGAEACGPGERELLDEVMRRRYALVSRRERKLQRRLNRPKPQAG